MTALDMAGRHGRRAGMADPPSGRRVIVAALACRLASRLARREALRGRVRRTFVGKANRERRRAKLKDRERERQRRDFRKEQAEAGGQPRGGWQHESAIGRQAPLQTARYLVSAAVAARFGRDQAGFAQHVACLAAVSGNAPAPGWRRIVGRAVWASLEEAVTTSWQRGWQPAEVVRQVQRTHGDRHARLAADAIAGQMRRYAVAAVDERWAAQLTASGASAWWQRDDEYLDRWGERETLDRAAAIGCALDTLFALAQLPGMSPLLPLPGTAHQGTRAAAAAEHAVDQRMLQRVRALLAKAESTEFAEEAEALTARAQELMARHSIDEAVLASATARRSERSRMGEASGRRLFIDNPYEATKAVLLDVIAKANRCRAIWHKPLGLSTVVGFPSDLGAVELLFTSLLVQATTAMLAAGSRQDAHGRSRTRSFRQSFLAAYAQRIGERLAEATGDAERQAAADSPGRNLLPVLAARSQVVDEAFEAMFPGSAKFSAGSVSNREGWFAGRAAADLATLPARPEVTGDAA
jgi:hypothetical protein